MGDIAVDASIDAAISSVSSHEQPTPVAGSGQTSTWKKLLYLKQPYPDNYTDISFLAQLRRNETVTEVSYTKLIDDFSLIVFHVNNLVLVILLFAGIYHYNWDPMIPGVITSVVSLMGYMTWQMKLNNGQFTLKALNSSLLIIFVLSILSPVLKSLTRSTSSDSIWSISFLLTFANLILHDYAMDISVLYYKPIVSTNISLSNALVLASRLSSTNQVFCFILMSVQINILLPLFDFSLRKQSHKMFHWSLSILLLLLVYNLLYKLVDLKIVLLWVTGQVFIVFVLPGYFIFLQRYKNELSGPWDIAKPIIRSKT